MSWYLVPSLEKLRDEINARYPHRDTASDGAVGDTSHAARRSSHNPDYAHGGAVRAIDIDINGPDWAETPVQQDILEAAIGDSRVWYVISNGYIYSRTYGWAKRRYSGSNPHQKHVHVSVNETPSQWKDTGNWLTDQEDDMTPAQARQLAEVEGKLDKVIDMLSKFRRNEYSRDQDEKRTDRKRYNTLKDQA